VSGSLLIQEGRSVVKQRPILLCEVVTNGLQALPHAGYSIAHQVTRLRAIAYPTTTPRLGLARFQAS
jgi:hypothetical protein